MVPKGIVISRSFTWGVTLIVPFWWKAFWLYVPVATVNACEASNVWPASKVSCRTTSWIVLPWGFNVICHWKSFGLPSESTYWFESAAWLPLGGVTTQPALLIYQLTCWWSGSLKRPLTWSFKVPSRLTVFWLKKSVKVMSPWELPALTKTLPIVSWVPGFNILKLMSDCGNTDDGSENSAVSPALTVTPSEICQRYVK